MSTLTRTVVAAVDMSNLSTLALDEAIEIVASRPASELHVLQVINPLPDAATIRDDEERLKQHVAARLEAAQSRGVRVSGLVVAHVTSGEVSNEIVQLATDLHADVITIGTHGRTGMERLLLGSVAESVVRRAPCPVFVLREKDFSSAVPEIEPPCPQCLATRLDSGGERLWCDTHSEHRARRHTYFNVRSDGRRHAPYSGGIA